MNSITLNQILGGVYGSWCLLGFYRGTKEYDFEIETHTNVFDTKMTRYNKDIEKYRNDKIKYKDIMLYEPTLPIKPTNFYITRMMYGFYGASFYAIPFTGPMCAVKELYRIEIHLRNIDNEKKTKFYNTVYSVW
jgi:hypothetical protein